MSDQVTQDYSEFLKTFDPEGLINDFSGSLERGINACVECCDRFAGDDKTALIWEGESGHSRSYSFADLKDRAAQVANLLSDCGINPGDRVAVLLPRIPELLFVLLGVLRAGAVYQPLFTAFGPKAIEHRLAGSGAMLVFTDSVNRPKLDEVDNCPQVVTIGEAATGDIDFDQMIKTMPATSDPVMRTADDLFLMLFTSGTTGLPKGVGVPLKALPAFVAYVIYGLDVREGDQFWNIADPGWAYGLYCGVLGPLLIGHSTIMYEGAFTVEKTYQLIAKYNVTNFAGAPTAYRMMIAAGAEVAAPFKGQLRVASSVGEPLNPEVMQWFADHLDCPLHDQYGQTEISMVLLNHHGLKHSVRPGSAGRQMPGFKLAVVDETGKEVASGTPGILAVDRINSPLFFFPGYLGREGDDWVGDYYLTGDTVEQDEGGTITFVGRSDDIITSAGYRIGPFDVESCLLEHSAVMESAVIGKPDETRGEIVKAFVILHEGYTPSKDLKDELSAHVKKRLGAHTYPREIEFPEALPKTPSGKIQRFLLRGKE